jgi:hypothetical protein
MGNLGSFLDHQATIYRATITKGRSGEEIRTLVAVATEVPISVRRPSARIGNRGPGLGAIGERVIYTESDVDLAERDVVQLTSGPDAGALVEIDSPPTRPRGHHLEATGRLWAGKLP